MKDQMQAEHPRTVLSRLDTAEATQGDLGNRVRKLEEWLDVLYRRVGIPYPGNEPAETVPMKPYHERTYVE